MSEKNQETIPEIPENCVPNNDGTMTCQEKSIDLGMVEGETHTDLIMGHVYLVVVAAILSLALTQIIKPFIWKTCSEKSDAVIRLFAIITGAVIAYTLSKPFAMIDVYMGASAGAINAFVIKMFKAKVKKSLGVETTPTPSKKEEEEE